MRVRAVLLFAGLLAAGAVLGWARLAVVQDRVKEKVDRLLGDMDVRRKEVELSLNGLREGIDGLRKAKIRAEVSAEQIQKQAKPQEQKLASLDSALQVLRGHLEQPQPIEIAGNTYDLDGVKEMANRVIRARKNCAGQLGGLHEAANRLQRVASTLQGKQQDAESRLVNIEGQLAAIDSNRVALIAMQQASNAIGDDGNLAKSLDHLEAKVRDLFAHVEAELRFQDERWNEVATKEIDATEAVVAGLQDHDTVAEIDAILGKRQPR